MKAAVSDGGLLCFRGRREFRPLWHAVISQVRTSGGYLASALRATLGFPLSAERCLRAAFVTLYILGWAVAPLLGALSRSDLDLFFWPTAQSALHGHFLTAYALQGGNAYPNANGPLGFLPLIPVVALADWLHLPDSTSVHAALGNAVGAVFILLMAREAMRIVAVSRGHVLWRFATPLVFVVGPPILASLGDYGHVEQPLELWLIFIAVRQLLAGSTGAAGIAIGLAILSRTTAALLLIPMTLVLVHHSSGRAIWRWVGGATVTVGLGTLPFLLSDPASVVHSLVTYRASLPIAGGSLWMLVLNTSAAPLVQRVDLLVAAGVAAALSIVILRRRTMGVQPASALLGCVAVAALCFPALAKTAYPYYLAEPWAVCCLWCIARRGALWHWRLIVPVLILADLFVLIRVTSLGFDTAGVIAGVASSLILFIAVAAIVFELTTSAKAPLGIRRTSRVAT